MATTLSVYKPQGMTPYGRKRHEQRTVSQPQMRLLLGLDRANPAYPPVVMRIARLIAASMENLRMAMRGDAGAGGHAEQAALRTDEGDPKHPGLRIEVPLEDC